MCVSSVRIYRANGAFDARGVQTNPCQYFSASNSDDNPRNKGGGIYEVHSLSDFAVLGGARGLVGRGGCEGAVGGLRKEGGEWMD